MRHVPPGSAPTSIGHVLIAAGVPGQRAREAWNSLVDGVTFDQLPDSVIRAMPQIYGNLNGMSDVRDLPRLRGVYRASWSSNVMLFGATRPVFADFNQQGIEYRVIKGAALSALAGRWGRRTMGDVDVVIADEHMTQALRVLHDRGFRPQVIDGEESDKQPRNIQGPYVSERRAILDIHSPQGRPDLFAELFRESGQVKQLLDVPIHVPSSELLLAIAVWHGDRAAAGTDHVQTLLDMGFLTPHVDLRKLRQIILRSDLLESAQHFFSELECAGVMETRDWSSWSRTSLAEKTVRFRQRARSLGHGAVRMAAIPRTVHRRKLTRDQRRALRSRTDKGARLYAAWSRVGQLGKLERFVHTRLGGFGDFGITGGPIPERDFRATIPATRGSPGRLRIHFIFQGDERERKYRALFIDGEAFGLVPLPGNLPGTYEVTPDADFVEISARTWSSSGTSQIDHAEIAWLSN